MKKIICLIISFVMVLSSLPAFAIEDKGTITWDQRTTEGSYRNSDTEWQFKPDPNYSSMQNPPSFSWPVSTNAVSYDIIIASDENLDNIVYEEKGITNNYYNFSYTFEAGKTYWWSVRYNTETDTSKWREASRFIILPEAYEYIMPDVDKMIKTVSVLPHPRMGVTKETLKEDRELKDQYPLVKSSYDNTYKLAEQDIAGGIRDESGWSNANDSVYRTGLVYQLSGEKRFGDFSKKQLLEMASWDVNGKTAYHVQDQHFRDTMYAGALAYDYVSELMTEEEKRLVLNMLRERIIILENPSTGLTDSIQRLNNSPFLSHGWTACGYLIGTCITLMGELPEAEIFFRKYFPIYINLVPHSYQDGDYSGGPSYWSYVGEYATGYCIEKITGFTRDSRPQAVNVWKVPLYYFSSHAIASFGDEGSHGVQPNVNQSAAMISNGATNPYVKWKHQQLALARPNSAMNYFLLGDFEKTEAIAPVSEPRSNLFKDTGVVAMHSDLVNETDKVSVYFRSSPFGSFNHAHPDQNAFHIDAFGERLAIDSGYYDSYQSTFDKGYTKKTYAHNGITFNGGIGQPYSTYRAKGKITNYLNHPDFDLASGDATKAYNYVMNVSRGGSDPVHQIDKAVRHLIYIRPDTFIVIDDLQAPNGNKYNFEWWLNAYENISLYEERNGARIVKGNAVLDAKVHYPKVTGYYSDIFSGPDLIDMHSSLGSSYQSKQVHKRVWFETPKVNKTKMITTMDVRRVSDEASYVVSLEKDGYQFLSFEDGTKAYVATSDNPFDTGRYQTDAAAIVVKGKTIMIVDATYLKKDGEEFFTADKKISLTYGKDEIGFSSSEDFKATVKTAEIRSLKDQHGVDESPEQNTRGFIWNWKDGNLSVEAYNGFYNYMINDKPLPGAPADDLTLKYNINDEAKETVLAGYINHDGDKVLSGKIENPPGFYKIEKISDIRLKGAKQGDIVLFSGNEELLSVGDNPSLKIKSVSEKTVVGTTEKEPEKLKDTFADWVEAENYSEKTSSAYKYSSRKFLSGGSGFTEFNGFGTYVTWEFNLPESGKYDLAAKYVGWNASNGYVVRLIEVNGKFITVNFPETGSYGANEEEWIASIADTDIDLKKGKNTIKIYALSGQWNMDWLGLKKN